MTSQPSGKEIKMLRSALLLVSTLGILGGSQAASWSLNTQSNRAATHDVQTFATKNYTASQGLEVAQDRNAPRFFCDQSTGEPTVMYSPRGQQQAYAWAVPGNMGSEWPAERRCEEISRRLESYRPDGLLELQTSVENGYDIVCATTEAVSQCRIVFTVPPGQDPIATRDRVFNNLLVADQGQSTEGVVTFSEGGNSVLDQIGNVLGLPSTGRNRPSGISLKPFLAPADGGTGERLGGSGRRLNPDNFR